MAQPHRHPTTGIFQLRRKVPRELRPVLGLEYKRSLATRDPHEAKTRFAVEWSKSDDAFALARLQASGLDILGAKDIQQLADRWLRKQIEALDHSGGAAEWLVEGPKSSWETRGGIEESAPLLSLRDALEGDPDLDITTHVDDSIRATLRDGGVPMPTKQATLESLRAAFRLRWLSMSDLAARRYEGDWLTSVPPLGEQQPLSFEVKRQRVVDGMRLLTLFDAYSEEKVLNDGDNRAVRKTVDAYRSTATQFVALMGDLPIAKIDRAVIRGYRNLLSQLPVKGSKAKGGRKQSPTALIADAEAKGLPRISEQTIRNKLKALSTVLSHGVRLGLIAENPIIAGGIAKAASQAATKKSAKTRRRKDYTKEELVKIFSSAIYAPGGWSPPRADFGKAWYWMPLLMYYTGARREELAQLKVRDVVRPAGASPYFSILAMEGDDDGIRSVKTEGSRRLIPLHGDLINRGFLGYVETLPDASGQLFPQLKPSPTGYYGSNFGKRWAEYLRGVVGLDCPVSPSHGFRHTFKTMCRAAGIPEDVHDAMTGHSTGSVARTYGGMPVSRMAEEIARFPLAPSPAPQI